MLAPYLRHLLQLTDKLPVFNQIPSNAKTLRDFFEIYLVQRGDIRTYEKRKIYSDNFFNFPGLDLPQFSAAIKKIEFNRKKDLKALSSFSNINPTANKLKIETQNQIDHFNLLLSRKLTNITIDMNPKKDSKEDSIEYRKRLVKIDLSYIIQNPAFFIGLFHKQQIFKSSQSDYAKKILLNQILNKFNFDFSTFKDCLIKDKEIDNISSDFTQYFSEASISTNFLRNTIVATGKFNKREYYQQFLETFPPHQQTEQNCKKIDFNKEFCDTIAQMIEVAFTEKSILRKLELFSNFFMLIENEVTSYLPAGEIPANDAIHPLQASILMRINPPDMLINSILIHDFINARLTSIPEKNVEKNSTFEITGYDSTIRIVPMMVFKEYKDKSKRDIKCFKLAD